MSEVGGAAFQGFREPKSFRAFYHYAFEMSEVSGTLV